MNFKHWQLHSGAYLLWNMQSTHAVFMISVSSHSTERKQMAATTSWRATSSCCCNKLTYTSTPPTSTVKCCTHLSLGTRNELWHITHLEPLLLPWLVPFHATMHSKSGGKVGVSGRASGHVIPSGSVTCWYSSVQGASGLWVVGKFCCQQGPKRNLKKQIA